MSGILTFKSLGAAQSAGFEVYDHPYTLRITGALVQPVRRKGPKGYELALVELS